LRHGSRDYSPIRVHKPEKKSTRLDQPRGQAQDPLSWLFTTFDLDQIFQARSVDLHPDGYAHQVQTGIVRASHRDGPDERKLLEPGQIYEYEIDLWATSYLFRKNHRLRLEISSSNFDHYARNLNNGEPVGFSDRIVKAQQTVHHSPRHPSRIVFWAID